MIDYKKKRMILRLLGQRSVLSLARIFTVMVCITLVATYGWLAWNARDVQLHDAEVETSNLSAALSRQASDTIKKADTILVALVDRLYADGRNARHLEVLRPLLTRHVTELAELQGLFIYDRDGRWLLTSFSRTPANASNTDREYFIYHRMHPEDDGPHIGYPVRSRTTGEWIIPVSRRLNDAAGNFDGVVLATISIEYFQQFYRNFDVRGKGAISLSLIDGTMLVRHPFKEGATGSSLASSPIFHDLIKQNAQGSVMAVSVFDGTERLYSYRRLDSYPLVITVALAKKDVLVEWRSDTWQQFIVVCVLAVLLALLGFHLIRQIKRGLQVETELVATRDALRAFNKRLEKLAMEDELTGLANRRRFMGALEEELQRAARHGRPIALLMLDVDYFKQYNDIYGHSAGDDSLRRVAQAIRSGQKRAADLAARYGGEEFCVLLPETDVEGARTVATQLGTTIAALEIEHDGCPWGRLTISAGVHACVPDVSTTASAMIQKADEALYEAKKHGRNRVRIYQAQALAG
jgi:diguanylate cyclase (GGDEF)-like protein